MIGVIHLYNRAFSGVRDTDKIRTTLKIEVDGNNAIDVLDQLGVMLASYRQRMVDQQPVKNATVDDDEEEEEEPPPRRR